MIAFADHQFRLIKPGKDGITPKEHLEQVERQTGRKIQELEPPDFPLAMSYIWSAFLSLNGSRTSGYSLFPLSFSEIKAFSELTNTPLSARDVETLKLLDRKYLEVMNSDG